MAKAATTTVTATIAAGFAKLVKPAGSKRKKTKYRYRPKKKPFVFTPWMLVRPLLAVAAAVLLYCYIHPLALALIEDDYSSRAVSKGRVLLRGAQQVATQRLIDGDSWEDTQRYLCGTGGLGATVSAAAFEVEPVEITRVTLDEKGLIVSMDCVLDYAYRRYRLEMDVSGDRYIPTLIEHLERPQKR